MSGSERHNTLAELEAMGKERGFFRLIGREHSALYVEQGKTLIVTFENLDHVNDGEFGRMPWGFQFVDGNGYSMLGMMALGWTWYRDEALFDFFDELRDTGFFQKFDRVVFYGASMGGYAACAFSAACPGATVLAISPQATLDRDVAIWESRYKLAWPRDFKSRYGYAPDMVASAEKMYLLFDPSEHLDAMHAALFRGSNIVKLKGRYLGHRMASLLQQMGVLKQIFLGCFEGTLSATQFHQLKRARRHSVRFQQEMLKRLVAKARHDLIVQYCEAVLNTRRGPKFRQHLNASRAILGRRRKS